MADKNVSMTLTVDAKQIEAAAAAQKKLADATNKTADAQKKLNEQIKATPTDKIAAAQGLFDKKYRQQNLEAAMSPQWNSGAPTSYRSGVLPRGPGGVAMSPAAAMAAGGAGGAAGGMGGLLKLIGGGLAVGAANRGVEALFNNARSEYGRPLGESAFAGVNGIPLLGRFSSEFERIGGGALGLSNSESRRQQADTATAADRRLDFNRQQFEIRGTGRAEMDALRVQQRQASSSAVAAERYAAGLRNTPNLGGFFHDAEFGVRTGNEGRLTLDRYRAGIEADQGRAQLGQSEAALRTQQQAEQRARENAARLAGEAVNANTERDRALRAQENKPGFTGVLGFGAAAYQANQTADRNVEQTTERATQAQVRANQANLEVRQQEESTQRRINELAALRPAQVAREYEVSKAQLALDKERLTIVAQQRDAARAGAIQSVRQDQGTKEATLQAIRDFKRDPNSINDDQADLLSSNPITRAFYERGAERIGRNDPIVQAQLREVGFGSADQLDRENSQLQADLERRGAEASATAARGLADALEVNIRQLGEAFQRVITDAINTLNQQISTRQNNDRTNARAESAI